MSMDNTIDQISDNNSDRKESGLKHNFYSYFNTHIGQQAYFIVRRGKRGLMVILTILNLVILYKYLIHALRFLNIQSVFRQNLRFQRGAFLKIHVYTPNSSCLGPIGPPKEPHLNMNVLVTKSPKLDNGLKLKYCKFYIMMDKQTNKQTYSNR